MCKYCKQQGHTKWECPLLYGPSKGQPSPAPAPAPAPASGEPPSAAYSVEIGGGSISWVMPVYAGAPPVETSNRFQDSEREDEVIDLARSTLGEVGGSAAVKEDEYVCASHPCPIQSNDDVIEPPPVNDFVKVDRRKGKKGQAKPEVKSLSLSQVFRESKCRAHGGGTLVFVMRIVVKI